MTKAIWVLIILVVGYVGYLLFQQWEKVQADRETQRKETAAAVVQGDSLPGLPYQFETGYRAAKTKSASVFQDWFKQNEQYLSDPRKAWIELEICKAMIRENPTEAKKIYTAVKGRVPPSSPVYDKVKELEKTFGP